MHMQFSGEKKKIALFSHAGGMALEMVMSVNQQVGPPLWSRLNYLNSYWMDYHEIYICTKNHWVKNVSIVGQYSTDAILD